MFWAYVHALLVSEYVREAEVNGYIQISIKVQTNAKERC